LGPTGAALPQLPILEGLHQTPPSQLLVLLPALKVSRSRVGSRFSAPLAGDTVEFIRVIRTVVNPIAHHVGPDASVRMRNALEVVGLAGVRNSWSANRGWSRVQGLRGREFAALEVCGVLYLQFCVFVSFSFSVYSVLFSQYLNFFCGKAQSKKLAKIYSLRSTKALG